MEEIVTSWFHSFNSDVFSPSEVIHRLVNFIESDVEDFGIRFVIDSELLEKKLSTAMCYLYRLHLEGAPLALNYSASCFYPEGWTSETEDAWLSMLEHTCFTFEYWEKLWECFPQMVWEEKVYNWREEFQAFIPLLIMRNIQKLSDNDDEMSSEHSDEDGGFISSED